MLNKIKGYVWQKFISKLKIKIYNNGSSRVVVCIHRYAIKLPRILSDDKFYGNVMSTINGWKGNRYEYIWSKSDIYPYLAKVKLSALFSFIIVMERAKELDREAFFNLDKSDYKFGGFEFKLDSFGVVNNEVKIIDYDGLNN